MRRWITFHDRAAPLVAYLARGDGRALAGSIPAWTPAELRAVFRPYERPRGRGLPHLTLSLPRGRTLTEAGWHDVAAHVLAATGGDWTIEPSIDGRDLLAPRHLVTGTVINPKAAGPAFSSAALLRRLALVARLRVARAALALRHLAGLVPRDAVPTLPRPKETDHDQHAHHPAGAAGGPLDPDGPSPGGRPQALPSPRPPGPPRGGRDDGVR